MGSCSECNRTTTSATICCVGPAGHTVVVKAFLGGNFVSQSGSVLLNSQGRGSGVVNGLSSGGKCYDFKVVDRNTNIAQCGGCTLALSRATIFAPRILIAEEEEPCQDDPRALSISFMPQFTILGFLVKFALKSCLSITRSSSVGAPVSQDTFDLLIPQTVSDANVVRHYQRNGTSGDWTPVDTLDLPDGTSTPDTGVSHIQSFSSPQHLNALAWLQPTGTLVAFEYAPATGEHQSIPVLVGSGLPITGVNGKQALVQTDDGLFHLLIPVLSDGKQQIVHLIHGNESMQQGSWKQVAILPPVGGTVISLGLVQTDSLAIPLKAVVRVRPSAGSDFLVSYQLGPNFDWRGPFNLASEQGDTIRNVSGDVGLVQSIFGDRQELDLLVSIRNPSTGDVTLTQFTQPAGDDTDIGQLPWTVAATLQPLNNDPRTQVISVSVVQDQDSNQAIAHVITPDGRQLLVFYLFTPQTGWGPPSIVTSDGQPISVGHSTPIPSLISLILDPMRVVENASVGTVTLSGPAPVGGVSINLVSGNQEMVRLPASVTIAEGQTTAAFQIVVAFHNALDTGVDISASLAGVTRTATLTVVGIVP